MTSTRLTTWTGKGSGVRQRVAACLLSSIQNDVDGA